jgi:hypothetical protein
LAPFLHEYPKMPVSDKLTNSDAATVTDQLALPLTSTPPYHLVVIGTQECQSTAANAVFFTPEHEPWEQRVGEWLGEAYDMIACDSIGAIHLMIFAWKPCLPWIRGE